MKASLLNIWLLFFSVTMLNVQAQSNELSINEIVFFLDLEDPDPGLTPRVHQIKNAIDSAGPELFDTLEKVISENQDNLNIVAGAFRLMDIKFCRNTSRCRNYLIKNKQYFTKDHYGLQSNLISLLLKCGHPEDAVMLLDVFRKSKEPRLLVEAAKALSQLGDGKTLAEMKCIFGEMKAAEIKRINSENAKTLKVNKQIDTHSFMIIKELPQESFLNIIAGDIVKYEKRIAKAEHPVSSQR